MMHDVAPAQYSLLAIMAAAKMAGVRQACPPARDRVTDPEHFQALKWGRDSRVDPFPGDVISEPGDPTRVRHVLWQHAGKVYFSMSPGTIWLKDLLDDWRIDVAGWRKGGAWRRA